MAPVCLPMWTHWRHLANMTELVLPSVHPSSQSKRKSIGSAVLAQLTAENPYIYNGFFLPQNFSSDWVSGPQLIHGSCVSLSRKPKRRVDRFSHFCIDDRRVSLYFTMGRPSPPQNCPFPWGIWTHMVPWAHPRPQPQQHLDRFSRFLQGSLV